MLAKIQNDKETTSICGLGSNVFKILDPRSREVIAYVGIQKEKKLIQIKKTCDIELLESIINFLKNN